MHSFKRSARVKEMILREVSAIIRDDVKDPRIGFVTVTSVHLADNLQYARIYISPMGSDEEKKATFKGVSSASRFIRRELGRKMRMKYIPEISFKWDETPQTADNINHLLHDIANEDIAD